SILTLACCGVVVLLATACGSAAPATSFEAGQPVEAAAATQSTREVPTPTPDNTILIDSIVLATELNDDGSPVDELVAIPANASVAYLAVLVRDIEENTRFEAEWLRNGEVIGHTET